jgi:hypothetical protein
MNLIQSKLLPALAVSALAASLLIAAAPVAAADQASPLVGTWGGSADVYYGGEYLQGTEKIIITTAKGNVAKGTWQWKQQGGTWSKPSPVQLIAMNSVPGEAHIDILGADVDGTYEGVLIPGVSLEIGYMDPQHKAAKQTLVLHSVLKKSK